MHGKIFGGSSFSYDEEVLNNDKCNALAIVFRVVVKVVVAERMRDDNYP
uniref:Uncharacterized protein n=1 Tax=Rhizophora mucronata TaxID=61149 RepID=A0A2P2IZ87_RHIMU